ncbi:hypothetical protein CASFOL_039716 [Castilleja foliolosa]|uniref:Uncharacterized protein n=1 Tax=Castilleja foliolosa TaxID=1961234 RepID=A0ABD3BFZ9_9LAMI
MIPNFESNVFLSPPEMAEIQGPKFGAKAIAKVLAHPDIVIA